ncbi:sulfite exporter TauE/SafE family protein [Thermomonospora cellulosilytica]|uniref:Probable membrane transporter protein n=1 Tax=Thermomonospora cellulosilytica TaxID=1411118 RepID=A0A7W3MY33_9ACTN|nr:sulfite exporter TauE/SafE family protein [Thermomonospora cellulosilytica]MBA9004053.1 putative membrane protein YfcA [Thermomonospora cellulosilytica]
MADLDFLLIGGLAALLGAIVQSSVGLGVGLVAAPVVTLLYPSLMPGAILVAAVVLPLATLSRELRHADLRGLGWAFGGRVAGTPLGVWVVAAVPLRVLGVLVGAMVLAALGVTLWSGRVPRNPATLTAAGLVAGATGTASAIGGPPIALLYQRESGPRVRATLAVFFTVGALLSLVTLAAVGRLPGEQVAAGLALTPFVLAGFVLAGPLRRFLDGGHMRVAVTAVVGLSAVVLIVRNLL